MVEPEKYCKSNTTVSGIAPRYVKLICFASYSFRWINFNC